MMKIYLAGPEVFFPAPQQRGTAVEGYLRDHGLEGVFPLNGEGKYGGPSGMGNS